MKKIFPVIKPLGLTPLKIVENFKSSHPEFRKTTVSYAGRLDPMAEGLLLLLVGNENKNREKYEDLQKTYETEIVFGVNTDTFDALGLIVDQSLRFPKIEEIKSLIESSLGKQLQLYPPYSSKTIKGKPLYWWARNNRLSEINIPKKIIEVYKIEVLEIQNATIEDLVKSICERIKNIEGDFRQEEILKEWDKFGEEHNGKKLLKVGLKIECSSGTYVRRLASDIGEKLGVGAFCYHIKRTRIGPYKI